MTRSSDRQAHQLTGEIGPLIGRLRRRFWTAAQPVLDRVDESAATWQLIVNIVRCGPLSQIDLARNTVQHPAGISRTLEDLARRKLVRRTRDPKDRRRVMVSITPAGRAYFDEMWPGIVGAMDDVLAPLSLSERRVLRDLLTRITT